MADTDWMHYTEERPCEDTMSRIDNIGQNGNDGLHYETELIKALYCTLQTVVDGKQVDYKRAKLLIQRAKEHTKGTIRESI